MKNWHIIKEYKASANTITCACDWIGNAGKEWVQHRKDNEGQKAPVGFNPRHLQYAPSLHPRSTSEMLKAKILLEEMS